MEAYLLASVIPLDGQRLGVGSPDGARGAGPQHPVAAIDDGSHRGVGEAAAAGAARLGERQPHGGLGRHRDAPVPEPPSEAKNLA